MTRIRECCLDMQDAGCVLTSFFERTTYHMIVLSTTIVGDVAHGSVTTTAVTHISLTMISVDHISISTDLVARITIDLDQCRSNIFGFSSLCSLSSSPSLLTKYTLAHQGYLLHPFQLCPYSSPLLLVLWNFANRCCSLCHVTCGSMHITLMHRRLLTCKQTIVPRSFAVVTTCCPIPLLRHWSRVCCPRVCCPAVGAVWLHSVVSVSKLIGPWVTATNTSDMKRRCRRLCDIIDGQQLLELRPSPVVQHRPFSSLFLTFSSDYWVQDGVFELPLRHYALGTASLAG